MTAVAVSHDGRDFLENFCIHLVIVPSSSKKTSKDLALLVADAKMIGYDVLAILGPIYLS